MSLNKERYIVLLSSLKINNIDMLNKYKENIIDFIDNIITKDEIIKIGTTKNDKLIEFLKDNNYKIEEISQNKRYPGQTNNKILRECDISLFLNYQLSTNMQKFIEISKSYDKKTFVLHLGEN